MEDHTVDVVLQEIKKLEEAGDETLSSNTIDGCILALNSYKCAIDKAYRLFYSNMASNGLQHQHFSNNSAIGKETYNRLTSKIVDASNMMNALQQLNI